MKGKDMTTSENTLVTTEYHSASGTMYAILRVRRAEGDDGYILADEHGTALVDIGAASDMDRFIAKLTAARMDRNRFEQWDDWEHAASLRDPSPIVLINPKERPSASSAHFTHRGTRLLRRLAAQFGRSNHA